MVGSNRRLAVRQNLPVLGNTAGTTAGGVPIIGGTASGLLGGQTPPSTGTHKTNGNDAATRMEAEAAGVRPVQRLTSLCSVECHLCFMAMQVCQFWIQHLSRVLGLFSPHKLKGDCWQKLLSSTMHSLAALHDLRYSDQPLSTASVILVLLSLPSPPLHQSSPTYAASCREHLQCSCSQTNKPDGCNGASSNRQGCSVQIRGSSLHVMFCGHIVGAGCTEKEQSTAAGQTWCWCHDCIETPQSVCCQAGSI